MPKISVIIPVYNGETYIENAIASVFSQTCKDWEIIIVDDGSTDGTKGILQKYPSDIRVIYQDNRGPSAARNRGLELASGEYAAFLDADDAWDARFLEITSRLLDSSSAETLGICTGWQYAGDAQAEHPQIVTAGNVKIFLNDLLMTNLFPIHAFLIRKDKALNVGGFDETIYAMEDWDLWLRMSLQGGYFVSAGQALAFYNLHGTSNSSNPDRMHAGRMRTIQKLFSAPQLPGNLRSREQEAIGRALLQNCCELYANNRDEEALQRFKTAVNSYPGLHSDDSTYYAMICAKQPVGYKSSPVGLDLSAGEERIFSAIDRVFADHSVPATINRSRMDQRAFIILGRLAFGQGRHATARKYFLQALKINPGCLVNANNLLYFLKSLFPSNWVAHLRRVKGQSQLVKHLHSNL